MPSPKKQFTVEQANAMLPLVRAITRDLVALSRDVLDRQERIDHLTSGREMEAGDPYEDELSQVKQELEKDRRRLREYASELEQLGVTVRSATDGVVDFPSKLEGRRVSLCWKIGEAEVLHWHEVDGNFDDRQLLAAASMAGEDHGDNGSELEA
jgi:hypothetical protein